MPFSTHQPTYRELLRQCAAEKPIVIDTETTGLGSNDTVIEVAAVAWDGTVLLDSLVQPFAPVPAAATAIHGIGAAALAHAPTWQTLWQAQLRDLFENHLLGIYNASFDLRLLQQTHRAARHYLWREPRHVCVMQLFAQYYQRQVAIPHIPTARSHKLSVAGKHFGISLPNSHRALADAQLALAVLHKLVETLA